MPAASLAHNDDDTPQDVVTSQKHGPPSALQLGPRKRLSVFWHFILKLADRFFHQYYSRSSCPPQAPFWKGGACILQCSDPYHQWSGVYGWCWRRPCYCYVSLFLSRGNLSRRLWTGNGKSTLCSVNFCVWFQGSRLSWWNHWRNRWSTLLTWWHNPFYLFTFPNWYTLVDPERCEWCQGRWHQRYEGCGHWLDHPKGTIPEPSHSV